MKQSIPIVHEAYPDTHHDTYSRTILGFWLYLLSDFILFGALFATYAVLCNNTFGGPSAGELFNLPSVLQRTLVLLLAAFTVGLAGTSAHRRHKAWTLSLFGATFVLGLLFLGMQISEFCTLLTAGHSWRESAFLSAYFTLLGTFSFHIALGLLWILVMVVPVCFNRIDGVDIRRLTCLRVFWQFLNIVWGFIFSFVYLLGVK